MAYATIMVHVGLDTASEARVGLAADLVDRFESTLIGIAATARSVRYDLQHFGPRSLAMASLRSITPESSPTTIKRVGACT
jgi:hypothetical protein